MAETSTKPYLIRAIYEWCNDNGFTPYLAVAVDEHTQVPREHVKAGEIVLNVSPTATNRLLLGNDRVTFQARFGGQARELSIPIENVSAIYARENGHGMAFDVPKALAVAEPGVDGTPDASARAAGAETEAKDVAAAPPAEVPSGPRAHLPRAALTRVPDPVAVPPEGEGAPPDDATPEGGGPRGRPRLTRVK
jgi:stringent starvation protein B